MVWVSDFSWDTWPAGKTGTADKVIKVCGDWKGRAARKCQGIGEPEVSPRVALVV